MRRLANYVPEFGARCIQIALGGDAVGGCAGQTRFGLADIGARDFAHPEAVLRGFQLAPQNLFVVDVQFEDRLIADHAHISRRRRQKHILFLGDHLGALRQDIVFRLADAGHRAQAAEQWLRDDKIGGAR